MSKTRAMWKASYLQLRIYLWCVAGFVAAGLLANIIVSLSVGDNGENAQVSYANMLGIFLIFVGSVLPVSFFKRIVNLGATRRDYFKGLLAVYAAWAAGFSLLNVLWFPIEAHVISDYRLTFNILEIFGWTQFGYAGMFLYQFGVYMLLLSLFTLLFSGLRHAVGWILWAALITAIPVGTSVPSLRPHVADGFLTLLFNDSLWQGFGLTILLSAVFLAGSWLFTRRRVF
ncbi:hypothetical protein [Cohnella caldifontis]|uniref:hypothetical protein n=1 Tax=Cohnella caldifontis TaxID=3027471 RepID=UPI0023EACC2F|nr:hypothetical protein [Cohnella sp. YIM B05605]